MTTALYRRYRPESFEDVIGQSHVTEPLMTALRKNKVNHAYLFSGPRGCGKTTSARILARCLNCAQGPTPTPCGQCESCRDLARDGAGSLDVIEMDAASHGGVDDARQLRERATFAPVRDRYKIFIIDEAHMVTRDGFNALLKIVEEPPEHIKFIFATTEPNKVLPTIRSRTHHYPFRLVPPEPLMEYLSALCEQEGVGVEPGVQAMVVRAGGGSVRDSLSVLDQLMAGTDQDQISYDLASSLLGYTHGALLDDVVDAFASGDAATVFRAVDRVIQTGQDPRRFVEDLLERFRDLVIVDAVPENAGNILHGTPEDQIARLRNQAHQMGASELSRCADITNEALTEMVGATSPQLHLELLCARLLLPSAENTTRGVGVRVDRLERRLNIGRTGAPTGPLLDVPREQASSSAGQEQTGSGVSQQTTAPEPAPAQSEQPAATASTAHDDSAPTPVQHHDAPAQASAQDQPETQEADPLTAVEGGFGKFRGRQPEQSAESREQSAQAPEDPAPAESAPDQTPQRPPHADESASRGPASGGEIDMIRNSWTEIIAALAEIHRVSWMTTMRGTPIAFDGSVLQLMFDAEGDRKNFPRFEPNLVQAIHQVLGVNCRVEAVGPQSGPGGARDDSAGPRGGGPRGHGSSGPAGPAPSGPGPAGNRSAGPGAPSSNGPRGRASASAQADSAQPGSGQREAGRSPSDPPGGQPQDSRGDDRSEAQENGGRETGPRPFPGQQQRPPQREQPQHEQARAQSRSQAPQDEAQREDAQQEGPQQDDSAEVTSWAVAPIPTSDPVEAAPAGPDAPAQDSTPEVPEAPAGPAPTGAAPTAAAAEETAQQGPAPEQSQSGTSARSSAQRAEQTPSEAEDSPPSAQDARAAWAQSVEPHQDAQGTAQPSAAREQTRSGERGESRAQSAHGRQTGTREQPAPSQRPQRSAQRRRGEDPSPDPVVPTSPYDDIPWPDEAPPEEEPPFEDPGFRGAPSRAAAGFGAGQGADAGPQHDTPAPQDTAQQTPTPPAEPAPEQPSQPAEPASVQPSQDSQQPPQEETPPEQWRPSTGARPATDSPGAAGGAGSAAAGSASGASASSSAAPAAPRKQSFRERHAAHFAAAQRSAEPSRTASSAPDLDSEATFSPSEDDEAVENTDQSSRALIERILGGRLLEEIPHQPGL
ncbi:DNA polymerase III subunit gamma and tau [Kocuria sp. p3-SID1433]|uniref:DNA polymerase III subunit gamma and tau n=1 Tax=unclassified Kocuria TaxID=2649579 RepID=UPI0021A35D55|nr:MULTISPECIES: DNA polymerase III subunit gamma and tau [unclassified Kocuria]MCT1601287.1 DNA polymerase III subunit gamma and tau [Kocuria sp. p3-SID1428]MCT2179215.1 DNA polymerase III subunit gamma and tau [Kocuria sp. p3-SID1433]